MASASVVFMLVWLSSLVVCCRLLFDCLIDIVVGLLITGFGFGVGLVAFLGLCVLIGWFSGLVVWCVLLVYCWCLMVCVVVLIWIWYSVCTVGVSLALCWFLRFGFCWFTFVWCVVWFVILFVISIL